tara:strand:- start:913 stop:1293 length:381 start_codon:yes stop_codon:yes gene_type:complete
VVEEPKPQSWHRNPFAPFKQEILSTVILPKIMFLLEAGEIKSKGDLLMRFKETYESGVSMTTFDEWLSDLGITFERVTKVNLPMGMTKPVKRQKMVLKSKEETPHVEEESDELADEVTRELLGGLD